jgi:hypothetical protein
MQMAGSESQFLRWLRKHSLLFGILVGVGCGLLIVLAMVYDLPLLEWLMERNIGWLRFAVYTVVIFAILAKNFRPQSPSIGFWTLFAGLLLFHLVCYVWFILRIRQLGALHYVVSGPFEVLLLAFLLKRGMRYLELDQADD